MARKKKPPPEATPRDTPFNPAFAALDALRTELPVGSEVEPGPGDNDDAGTLGSSPPVTLVLQREKKGRAGKTATRVRGLSTAKERTHWASTLKKQLGCGAVVDGDDLILLGDVGKRAKAKLEAAGFHRVVLGN